MTYPKYSENQDARKKLFKADIEAIKELRLQVKTNKISNIMENITYKEAKEAKEILIKYLKNELSVGIYEPTPAYNYHDKPREAIALLALEEIL